jgi:hypothetical protein
MNLRKSITSALFLAIGFVLHGITPGFIYGVKPDLMLVFMIISIAMYPSLNNAFIVGGGAGFLTALSTTMPGGTIGNFIDKLITSMIVLIVIKGLRKVVKNNSLAVTVTALFGTLVSGAIFLSVVSLIAGLPHSIIHLFTIVVLPTALINTIITFFIQVALDQALFQKDLSTK